MKDLFEFEKEVKAEIESRTGIKIELTAQPYLMFDIQVDLTDKSKPKILVYSAVRLYPNRVIALEEYAIACIKKGEIISELEAMRIYEKFA